MRNAFLGYPSLTDAIHALRRKGLTTREIADQIGRTTYTVVALELNGGKPRAVRPAERMGRTVVLAIDVLDALRPAAERRSISVNELVRRLIETIADDKLVDSVLDDAS